MQCRVGFGKSVIDFHVNVGFSREGASQVGEIMGSFKWLVIHKDVWLLIHLSRCRLVHDSCLLGADGKTKVVSSSRKVIHALLHFRFSVDVKSAVVRILHPFCTSVGCHRHYIVKRCETWQRAPCWRG